jgi:hypothetical protein
MDVKNINVLESEIKYQILELMKMKTFINDLYDHGLLMSSN